MDRVRSHVEPYKLAAMTRVRGFDEVFSTSAIPVLARR